jgi:hypothetical protein
VAYQLVEVVRGMCGRPAAILTGTSPAVQQVLAGIARAGRQPVLMADYPQRLAPYGGTPRHVVNLRTTVDSGVLLSPPVDTRPFAVSLWMTVLPG